MQHCLILRRRRGMQIAVRVDGPDVDEPVGIGEGHRAQKYGINETEDGGVCAEAKGEGEYRGGCEDRTFAEQAQCEANVLCCGVEEGAGADVADVFFDLFEAAEFDFCLAKRFSWILAGGDFFFGEEIEIGAEFFVSVEVEAVAAEEIADETFCASEERHFLASVVAQGEDGVN